VVTSDVWRTRLEHPLPAADQWVHVAFTHARDGTSKLYIDGNEVPARRSLASASGSPIPADAQLMDHMSIGFAWRPGATWSQQGFRGQMDELTLYDRALSTQEIAALAGGTQPRL
jgi:hypothetical protein